MFKNILNVTDTKCRGAHLHVLAGVEFFLRNFPLHMYALIAMTILCFLLNEECKMCHRFQIPLRGILIIELPEFISGCNTYIKSENIFWLLPWWILVWNDILSYLGPINQHFSIFWKVLSKCKNPYQLPKADIRDLTRLKADKLTSFLPVAGPAVNQQTRSVRSY
jgi:hypothetical protein